MLKLGFKATLICLSMSFSLSLFGQNFEPPITFQKFYSFSTIDTFNVGTDFTTGDYSVDELYSVTGGNYVLLGALDTVEADPLAHLSVIDCEGRFQWGITAGQVDTLEQIQPGAQILDSGDILYVANVLDEDTKQNDVVVVRLSSGGIVLWKKRFGTADGDDLGHSITETFDGGIVIAGSTNSFGSDTLQNEHDILLFKLDSVGVLQWDFTFGNSGVHEKAMEVVEDGIGNIVMTGLIDTDTTDYAFLMKCDTFGNALVMHAYAANANLPTVGWDLIPENRTYAITGNTDVGSGDPNQTVRPFLLVTDTAGVPQINNQYLVSDGNNSFNGFGQKIIKNGGGYALAVHLNSLTASTSSLFTIEPDGDLDEAHIYLRAMGNSSIASTDDGGMVITGNIDTSSMIHPLLIKTDGDFQSGCEQADITPVVSVINDAWIFLDSLTFETWSGLDSLLDTIYFNIQSSDDTLCKNIPDVMVAFDSDGFCWNDPFLFTNNSTGDTDTFTWQWDFGDGAGMDDQFDPMPYMYSVGGDYAVTLSANYECITRSAQSIVHVEQPFLVIDTMFCSGESIEAGGQTFTQSGSVVVPTNNCDSLIVVNITPTPPIPVLHRLKVCSEVEEINFMGTSFMENDTVTPVLIIDPNGCDTLFGVTVNIQIPFRLDDVLFPSCAGNQIVYDGQVYNTAELPIDVFVAGRESACDTIVLLALSDADLIFPNAFTPLSSPNINDEFGPLDNGGVLSTLSEYNIKIYNRWGELIFETSDPQEKWGGECGGEACPSDVFIFYYQYRIQGANDMCEGKGDVALLR